jgi:hypothetical protein
MPNSGAKRLNRFCDSKNAYFHFHVTLCYLVISINHSVEKCFISDSEFILIWMQPLTKCATLVCVYMCLAYIWTWKRKADIINFECNFWVSIRYLVKNCLFLHLLWKKMWKFSITHTCILIVVENFYEHFSKIYRFLGSWIQNWARFFSIMYHFPKICIVNNFRYVYTGLMNLIRKCVQIKDELGQFIHIY